MKDSRTDGEALDHNYTEGITHKKQEQAQQFKIRLATGTYSSVDAGQLCAEMLFDREKYRLYPPSYHLPEHVAHQSPERWP